MLEIDHLHLRGVGHIHHSNDAGDATQVVGVIGDHQGVIPRVGIDGVIGADQGPQNGHQITRRFKIKFENLRHDLTAARALRRTVAGLYRTALQFGIGLRNHFEQPGRLHHGEALQAQAT